MSQRRDYYDDSREAGEIVDEPPRSLAAPQQQQQQAPPPLSVSFSSFAAMADANAIPPPATPKITPPAERHSSSSRWNDGTRNNRGGGGGGGGEDSHVGGGNSSTHSAGGRYSYPFNGPPPRGNRGGMVAGGGRGRSRGGGGAPFVATAAASRGGGSDGFASRGDSGSGFRAPSRGEGSFYRGGSAAGRMGLGRGGRYSNMDSRESGGGRGRFNTRGSGRFASSSLYAAGGGRGGDYMYSNKRRRDDEDSGSSYSSRPHASPAREQQPQEDEDGTKRVRHNNLSIGSEGEIPSAENDNASPPRQKSPSTGRSSDYHRMSIEATTVQDPSRRFQSKEQSSERYNWKGESSSQFRRESNSAPSRWNFQDDQESQRSERSFRSDRDSKTIENKAMPDERVNQEPDFLGMDNNHDRRSNWKESEGETSDRKQTSHWAQKREPDASWSNNHPSHEMHDSRWNNDEKSFDRGSQPPKHRWNSDYHYVEQEPGQQWSRNRSQGNPLSQMGDDSRFERETEQRWAEQRAAPSVRQPAQGGSRQQGNRYESANDLGPGLENPSARRMMDTNVEFDHELHNSQIDNEKATATEIERRSSQWNKGFGSGAERPPSSRWNTGMTSDVVSGYQDSHFLDDRRAGLGTEQGPTNWSRPETVSVQRQSKGDRSSNSHRGSDDSAPWSKGDTHLSFKQERDEARVLQSSVWPRSGPRQIARSSSDLRASSVDREVPRAEAPGFSGDFAMKSSPETRSDERREHSEPNSEVMRRQSGTLIDKDEFYREDLSLPQRRYASVSEPKMRPLGVATNREESLQHGFASDHASIPLDDAVDHRINLARFSEHETLLDSEQGPPYRRLRPTEDLSLQGDQVRSPHHGLSTKSLDGSEQGFDRGSRTASETALPPDPSFRRPLSDSRSGSLPRRNDHDSFSDAHSGRRPFDEQSYQNESQSVGQLESNFSHARSSRQGSSNEPARSPLSSAPTRRSTSQEMILPAYNPPLSEVDVRVSFGRGRGFRGRDNARGRGRFIGTGDHIVRSISSFGRGSDTEGGRFSDAVLARNNFDETGRGRGEFGRRSFFDSGRGRSQFARSQFGGRGRHDFDRLSSDANSRGFGEATMRSDLTSGSLEEKSSDRSPAPRLATDGSGRDSPQPGISGGGSFDSTSHSQEEGRIKRDDAEHIRRSMGGRIDDNGAWRGRGRGRTMWNGLDSAGRGRHLFARSGVDDSGRGRGVFVRGRSDEGGRSYSGSARSGYDEGGRGRNVFARVGQGDGGRGRNFFARIGPDGGGRGRGVTARIGLDDSGRGRSDFHRESMGDVARGRGRLSRGRVGEGERGRGDFGRVDFSEAGRGRVGSRPAGVDEGGRGPRGHGESRGGPGGRDRFSHWGRGDSGGRWLGFAAREGYNVANQGLRQSPTESSSLTNWRSRSPQRAERRTSLGASSLQPSEKSPEYQSHDEEMLREQSMMEESSVVEEVVNSTPPMPEQLQTPTSPPTPPPEPSKPSAVVSALTRLIDLEAQMEYAYAKHMKIVTTRKLLRAQYEVLEKLPVGMDAFQEDLDKLVTSLQKSTEKSEAGESKQ